MILPKEDIVVFEIDFFFMFIEPFIDLFIRIWYTEVKYKFSAIYSSNIRVGIFIASLDNEKTKITMQTRNSSIRNAVICLVDFIFKLPNNVFRSANL